MKSQRPARKLKTRSKKENSASGGAKTYFSTYAVVLERPEETCHIYRYVEKKDKTGRIRREGVIQLEVLTKCILINGDMATCYPVRFVHNRTLAQAKRLISGNHIFLEQARFKKHPGRKELEVHVKRFSIRDDD